MNVWKLCEYKRPLFLLSFSSSSSPLNDFWKVFVWYPILPLCWLASTCHWCFTAPRGSSLESDGLWALMSWLWKQDVWMKQADLPAVLNCSADPLLKSQSRLKGPPLPPPPHTLCHHTFQCGYERLGDRRRPLQIFFKGIYCLLPCVSVSMWVSCCLAGDRHRWCVNSQLRVGLSLCYVWIERLYDSSTKWIVFQLDMEHFRGCYVTVFVHIVFLCFCLYGNCSYL